MGAVRRWGVDCLGPEGLPSIKEGSVDLIIADPPYYGVVKADWDNQWRDLEEYNAWCEKWIEECWRTLRIGGTMWLFGYFRNLIGVLGALDNKKWAVKQQIVLNKGQRAVARRNKESLRTCPTATESVVLLVKKGVIDLLKNSGWTGAEANKRLGQKGRGGGKWSLWMHEHCMPSEEDLKKLDIRDRCWQTWNKEVVVGLTDVWDDIDWYCGGKRHLCEKPRKLIERLVELSSCKGDFVVDPFMGSGIVGDVCESCGRDYLGIEIEQDVRNKK